MARGVGCVPTEPPPARVDLHVRVARDNRAQGGYRADASLKPRAGALRDPDGYDLWTVRALIRLRIPHDMLRPPAAAEIEVELSPADLSRIAPEVLAPPPEADQPEESHA